MMALQRQGRIGFYGEAMGQEAAVVGSAAAIAPEDWIVPALREAGVGLYRGMTLDSYIAQIFGNAADVTKGRQMPCHPCDREHHYVVMSSCVSTQIPHAVGIAMAMKIAGDRGKVCFGYMGDGGTSASRDFHVALNFAGVMKAPCVLICQNNQWAISTPGHAADRRRDDRAQGRRLRRRGAARRRQRRVRGLRGRAVRRRQGAPRRRPDVHRAAHVPRQRALELGRSVALSRREGHRGVASPARSAAPHRGVPACSAAGSRPASARRSRRSSRPTCATRSRARKRSAQPALETLIDDVYEEPTWNLREQLAELAAGRAARSRRTSTAELRHARCDTRGCDTAARPQASAAASWNGRMRRAY